MKETRAEAEREARIWLTVRGTLYPPYINEVLDPDEAALDLLASDENATDYEKVARQEIAGEELTQFVPPTAQPLVNR